MLTGSQRVPGALGSDAYTNLRQAILLASDGQSRDMGVLLLFNERIFSPRYLMKIHASNVDAFTSPGYGCLGTVDQNQIYIYQRPVHKEFYAVGTALPDVDIIKCYGGFRLKIGSVIFIGKRGPTGWLTPRRFRSGTRLRRMAAGGFSPFPHGRIGLRPPRA